MLPCRFDSGSESPTQCRTRCSPCPDFCLQAFLLMYDTEVRFLMWIPKVLFFVAVTLPFSRPVPAQSNFGEVDGYVEGSDGKGIQGAVVSFDRLDYKSHTETKTDKKGAFGFYTL